MEALAVTAKATVPEPLPELPLVIVIQPALLVAVQEHPVNVVTATNVVPAPALIDSVLLESA